MSDNEFAAPPVAQQLEDRPDSYSIRAVWAAGLGYAMEGYDNFILGFALSGIVLTFGLTKAEAGSIATITLLGAVLGAFVFGILSDYKGRVKVLAWSIILFAVFTGLTALAQDFTQMAVLRFFAGIGIGGEYGIGMALVSEAWPAKWRARATSLVALSAMAGLILADLAGAFVLPLTGWRVLFAIGVFPALIAAWYRRFVPEPPIFLAAKGKPRKFPLAALFSDARTTRTSIGIIILTSVQNWGYYGIIIFLPISLQARLGLNLTKSALWTGATILGFIIGMPVFGFLADRIGRKPAFYIYQVGAIVSLLAYSQLTTPVAMLIGGVVLGIFVNGMLGGYGAVTAECYPTEARGTAQNVLYNLGRAVGAFSPIVVGLLAAQFGFAIALGSLAFVYILAILATAFLIPETRGEELT